MRQSQRSMTNRISSIIFSSGSESLADGEEEYNEREDAQEKNRPGKSCLFCRVVRRSVRASSCPLRCCCYCGLVTTVLWVLIMVVAAALLNSMLNSRGQLHE